MVPIIIAGDKEFGNEEFKRYLTRICKEHKDEERALAFAFIVYDFGDHTITDILEKRNYWSSLDVISGKFLSVFYINSKDSYYDMRQKQIYEQRLRQQKKISRVSSMSYLVPVTLDLTPMEKTVGFIKREFGIDKSFQTPFVLFFQIDNDANISDSFVVSLGKEKLEDAFLELKFHIKNAVESLSKVDTKYYKNHQEIFDLIKEGVRGGLANNFYEKNIKSKISIDLILSLISMLGVG